MSLGKLACIFVENQHWALAAQHCAELDLFGAAGSQATFMFFFVVGVLLFPFFCFVITIVWYFVCLRDQINIFPFFLSSLLIYQTSLINSSRSGRSGRESQTRTDSNLTERVWLNALIVYISGSNKKVIFALKAYPTYNNNNILGQLTHGHLIPN